MGEKLIALDIGGVCLELRPESCFGGLGFASLAAVPVELHAAVDLYERGVITGGEFLDDFRLVTGSRLGDGEIIAAWNRILHAEIPGINELVTQLLANQVKIVLFSDTSPIHMKHFRETFPIAWQLPYGIYSFEVGAKKPDQAMYAAFEKQFGQPTLYIDDRQPCIEGGRVAGWPVYHFQSVSLLEEQLRELALL